MPELKYDRIRPVNEEPESPLVCRLYGSLVLDPMCGSGTTCVAARQLGRRYLGIDSSPQAISVTHERLGELGAHPPVLIHPAAPDNWDDGRNRLVLGNTREVLESLPEGFVDLIYIDPPFGTKADKAFGITWKWDESADKNLDRFSEKINTALELASFIKPGIEKNHPFTLLLQQLEIWRAGQPARAAYLVWIAEILCELKRVLRDTGSIYLHCDPGNSHYLKVIMDHIFGGGVD